MKIPKRREINNYHQLTAPESGMRLDKFISENCPDLSRTQSQKLIEDGFVTVNGQPAKSSLKLTAGDTVEVRIPPPTPSDLTPEPIPLQTLYEY